MTDTEYEAKRNALIPKAVKYANKTEGRYASTQKHETWASSWNRAYLRKMTELAEEIK